MRFQWVSLVLLGMTVAAFAQEETPGTELFTGYSFARVHLVDADIFTNDHANLNGWNAGFDWNANQRWGITGDFSGYYGGPSFVVIFKPHVALRVQPDYLAHPVLQHATAQFPHFHRPGLSVWNLGLRGAQ